MYKERLWGVCTNAQRKALGSLHKYTKKGSGESAQMHKERLWGVCTKVQRKALGSLHKCTKKASGESAQMYKESLWRVCTFDCPDPFFACQYDCDKVQIRKHSGSAVEFLTPDQGVAGLSLTACAVLGP